MPFYFATHKQVTKETDLNRNSTTDMKNLPSNFLLVNHEGVFRVYMSMEEVSGLDQLLSKHASHRLLMLKNLVAHPNGMIHVAIHTREGSPIFILEANQGVMQITTEYRSVKIGNDTWISPRFFVSDHSFNLTCAFDFAVWSSAGFKMFFAINILEMKINLWTTFKGQNYRVPFGNVYEDARICMGEDDGLLLSDMIRDGQTLGWAHNFTVLLDHLSASNWNSDAIQSHFPQAIARLVRFVPKTLEMLPPYEPDRIAELGVMAHTTLAEVTKLLL